MRGGARPPGEVNEVVLPGRGYCSQESSPLRENEVLELLLSFGVALLNRLSYLTAILLPLRLAKE